ncbi:MAG: oligopeptide/dipeptide ABC transporter ATP-binding protein [Rhodospirillaceae bacterium]
MASTNEVILSARNLAVGFDSDTPIFSGIDLDINSGEIVGLTGGSGSGKSTLAYALLGLTKHGAVITSGEVNFNGQNLLSLTDTELEEVRGRDIALIVQNPRAALHPMYQVGRQIGRVWKSHVKNSIQNEVERAIDMLRLVGINDPEHRAEAFVHELSGGMAQRVLIALALSTDPKVLIADEPTSGLDVTVQAQFLDTMWDTARKTGTAMVIVTQEPGILSNYCDRIVELSSGQISHNETATEYFSERPSIAIPSGSGPAATVVENEEILRVENLCKSFPLRGTKKVVQAVDGVTLSLLKGESVGLVGESGSGKSTVGRCLLRLIESDSGLVEFDGQDLSQVTGHNLRKLRRRVQIVQQDPYDSFDPRWNIRRALSDPLLTHEIVPAAEIEQEIRSGLARVSVEASALDAKPKDISAGVLQRIAIARSLLTRPDFLILDEPTSLLAPEDRKVVLGVLQTLRSELGLTYLLISHDLTSVANACDRVVVMYLGQIVEIGPTRSVFRTPVHPYTKALIGAHLNEDPAVRRVDHDDRNDLSGEIPSPIDLPRGCYLASRCPSAIEGCHIEQQVLRSISEDIQVRCMRAEVPISANTSQG